MIFTFVSPKSLYQGLMLEQERLMSDYEKLKAKEQEKDTKLQALLYVLKPDI